MKFMIHSCNARLWYVNQFLIPELIRQGISENDIFLHNDYDHIGCLKMFVKSAQIISESFDKSQSTWHLQDDILLSDNFAEVALSVPFDIVCNGFVTKCCNPQEIQCIGYQPVKNYWMSFPCCHIPNAYMAEFLDWFLAKHKNGIYEKAVRENKYDDMLFWAFMKTRHSNDRILNIVPNIVQHIDYAIGGSTVNQQRTVSSRSAYWTDEEKEREICNKIMQERSSL